MLNGNISEPGNAGASLWKSSLFFLTVLAALKWDYPEIGRQDWKSDSLVEVVRCARDGP